MKTPQEIAADVLRDRIANPDISDHGAAIQAAIVEAIEADRAQRYDSDAVSDIGDALLGFLPEDEGDDATRILSREQVAELAGFLAAEGFSRR